MAEWLTVRPDGRTVKAAYAEAARLACELRAHADADAPRQRERRPALVLTRELRECLERIVARVERGEAPPAGTEEALTDVEALLSGHR